MLFHLKYDRDCECKVTKKLSHINNNLLLAIVIKTYSSHQYLPMDKTSTPQLSVQALRSSEQPSGPSRLTLAIIRQFARSYHVERPIQSALNAFILN